MKPIKINFDYLKNYKSAIQVGVGAFLVSFSAVFVKLSTAGPTIEGFYRMLFGGTILLLLALIRREKLWSGKAAFTGAILAGILFASDLIFWHRSIDFLGPGLATLLLNLQVFFLAIFGVIFHGEKLSSKFLFSLPLALVGMYLLVGYDWNSSGKDFHLGIGLALIGMIFYVFYLIVLRRNCTLCVKYQPISQLAILSLASAAFAGFVALFQHESFNPGNMANWWWLLLYGIFGQVLGWLCISLGLAKIRLSLAGFLLLFQPALAFMWGVLIFGQIPTWINVLGIFITLIAIYMGSTAKSS